MSGAVAAVARRASASSASASASSALASRTLSTAHWPTTIVEAARALANGELTSSELCAHARRRVDVDALIARAYVPEESTGGTSAAAAAASLASVSARDARASDERRATGETLGALDGVPFAVKDNLCARDGATTAGSAMLRGYRSPHDATSVGRLRAGSGGVMIGKTNLDEFGMGSHTNTSAYGVTLNPTSRDGARSSGGSSGGSAAAVASGSAFYALGSDTGGSVRLPAAYCGVVGLKPSYGRVSRFGLISYCSSLDTVGVLARTVGDAGIVLAAMQGEDALDPTTVGRCEALDEEARRAVAGAVDADVLAGLRIGIPEEYAVDEMSQETYDVWNEAARLIKSLGAEIVPVKMPHTKDALPCYYVVAPAEASSNLARYDGLRYGDLREQLPREAFLKEGFQSAVAKAREAGFGDEVRRRVLVGTFALSSERTAAYFEKAQRVRRLVADDFENIFRKTSSQRGVDLLLTPSSVSTAPKLEDLGSQPPEQTYAADVMTVPASLAGLPAMSMPMARSRVSGLPIGVQLIAPRFREASLVRVGSRIESATRRSYSTSAASSSTEIDALRARGWTIRERRDELVALISTPGMEVDKVIEANKELSRIEPMVEQYELVESLVAEKASLEDLIHTAQQSETSADDKEIVDMAREELATLEEGPLPEAIYDLRTMFLPRDEADERGAILEVRAGAGGDEAALFAADLFRMYMLHCRKRGWHFDILTLNETDGKGIREASAEVLGDGVFGRLKFESGVHRVQRVPETETQGRVHTSTASVAVLPHAEEVEMDIKDEDVRVDTMRASGAGGQHVNTTNSAVRLTHIPTGITVVIQDERSQHKNKAKAFSVLKSRLYEMEREKLAKERSELRSSLIGSADRSERIRTYNFAQGRVKDHRVSDVTISDVRALMDGFLLEDITDALVSASRAEQLGAEA